jgi:hypothetical protein
LAKRKRRFGEDLDWYLIPISTLKRIGVVLLLAVFAGVAGYFTYTYINSDKAKAHSLLKDAFTAVERIPKIPDFTSRKEAYVRLQERLQNAQQAMTQKDYVGVQAIAAEVLQRAGTLLADASGGREKGVEEILDLEGKVQVQRKDQGMWEDAKPRMPLFPGDFIKTGNNGSVRIISESNSTIIILGPKSLHEVAQPTTSAGGQKEHRVNMVYGTTDIFTQNQRVQVKTIQAQAEINPNSAAYISVNENREEFRIDRGNMDVNTAGEPTVTLNPLEKVNLSNGKATTKIQFLAAPKLLDPIPNKTFSYSPGMKVKLQWEKVPGTAKYHVQVSPSIFFVEGNLLGENRKADNYQSLGIAVPADYYWRVAAIDAKGVEGSPSNPYKFKVVPRGLTSEGGKTPPPLTVSASPPLGSMCPIRGQTNPGTMVTVDGEDALMNEDGSFQANVTLKNVGYNTIVVKAVDPNGNETVKKIQVFVPDY